MMSASLPLPRMSRGFILLRRCKTVSRTVTLSDRASSASSARESSARFFTSVVTLMRMARSPFLSTALACRPPLSSPSMAAIKSSTDSLWLAGCTGSRKAQFFPSAAPGSRCVEYILSGKPSPATLITERRSRRRKSRSIRSSSLISSPARWV